MTWNTDDDWDAGTVDGLTSIGGQVQFGTKVDTFEPEYYGDLGNTLSDYYFGSLSYAQRQQNTVLSEDYTLQMDTDGAWRSIQTEAAPGQHPTKGDTIESLWRAQDSANIVGLWFGSQEPGFDYPDNAYGVYLLGGNESFELVKRSAGSVTTLDSAPQTLPAGEQLKVEVLWDDDADDTITATLYDSSGTILSELMANDGEYTSGAFGYSSNNQNANASTNYHDRTIIS